LNKEKKLIIAVGNMLPASYELSGPDIKAFRVTKNFCVLYLQGVHPHEAKFKGGRIKELSVLDRDKCFYTL
jgi:hypothetical protein